MLVVVVVAVIHVVLTASWVSQLSLDFPPPFILDLCIPLEVGTDQSLLFPLFNTISLFYIFNTISPAFLDVLSVIPAVLLLISSFLNLLNQTFLIIRPPGATSSIL